MKTWGLPVVNKPEWDQAYRNNFWLNRGFLIWKENSQLHRRKQCEYHKECSGSCGHTTLFSRFCPVIIIVQAQSSLSKPINQDMTPAPTNTPRHHLLQNIWTVAGLPQTFLVVYRTIDGLILNNSENLRNVMRAVVSPSNINCFPWDHNHITVLQVYHKHFDKVNKTNLITWRKF